MTERELIELAAKAAGIVHEGWCSDSFRQLNEREPKISLLRRLLKEAQQGRPSKVSVIEALEFRRAEYGLKKVEFAAILGLQPSHYSEVLSGKRRLPVNAMKRAFAVGVPASVLLQTGAMNRSRAARRGKQTRTGSEGQATSRRPTGQRRASAMTAG